MNKRKRYFGASYFEGKFIIFDGCEWMELKEAAYNELEEMKYEKSYNQAV